MGRELRRVSMNFRYPLYKTWHECIMEALIYGKLDERTERYMKSFEKWKNGPATEKQLAYILEMQEFSEFPLPPFTGKSKGEAAKYIDEHIHADHESTRGIEHGY